MCATSSAASSPRPTHCSNASPGRGSTPGSSRARHRLHRHRPPAPRPSRRMCEPDSSTALAIAPAWHLKMQAAVQRHVDAAVAKSINLPADADPRRRAGHLPGGLAGRGQGHHRQALWSPPRPGPHPRNPRAAAPAPRCRSTTPTAAAATPTSANSAPSANTQDFHRRALAGTRCHGPPRWFVLNVEGNVEVDFTALEAVETLRDELGRDGTIFALDLRARPRQDDLLVRLEAFGLAARSARTCCSRPCPPRSGRLSAVGRRAQAAPGRGTGRNS